MNKTHRPSKVHSGIACHVVGIVSSAGGVKALGTLLSGLPSTFPAPIIIVQHMAPLHKSVLAGILAKQTPLTVSQATEGDRIRPGHVYVAPPNKHVVVNPDETLSLTQSGRVRRTRPSGDVLFAPLAVSCQHRSIAVVLTGCDYDGSIGARLVKAVNGTVIAQDRDTSEYFDMPHAAIATGAVDFVLPLEEIGPRLIALTSTGCWRTRRNRERSGSKTRRQIRKDARSPSKKVAT